MKTTALSFNTNSSKETIIELLSTEWPLTAKKMHRRLIKKYHRSITYQAVHKALTELAEKNIIEKGKEGYRINKSWLKQLGEFSQKLEQELEDKNKKSEVKAMHRFVFTIHNDFIKFVNGLMEEMTKKEGKLNVVFHFRHVPYPHVLSNEDMQKIKALMPQMKWTMMSMKGTTLDRWNAQQWRKLGVKVVVGADIAADRRIIMNDIVINAYMSKEALRRWDKMYAITNLNKFDINSLNKAIFNARLKTIVTLVKDKDLAEMLL